MKYMEFAFRILMVGLIVIIYQQCTVESFAEMPYSTCVTTTFSSAAAMRPFRAVGNGEMVSG